MKKLLFIFVIFLTFPRITNSIALKLQPQAFYAPAFDQQPEYYSFDTLLYCICSHIHRQTYLSI